VALTELFGKVGAPTVKAVLIVIGRLLVLVSGVGVVVSVTVIAGELVPAVEGEPVIKPLALMLRPAGNPVAV
jgi:hypothetical protein